MNSKVYHFKFREFMFGENRQNDNSWNTHYEFKGCYFIAYWVYEFLFIN